MLIYINDIYVQITKCFWADKQYSFFKYIKLCFWSIQFYYFKIFFCLFLLLLFTFGLTHISSYIYATCYLSVEWCLCIITLCNYISKIMKIYKLLNPWRTSIHPGACWCFFCTIIVYNYFSKLIKIYKLLNA